ncbi:hypothetical protein T4B_7739 [Trichinella pseudospiralis]|uniref:Uncharacterized protein n=1 Tax=Trichinella pseudospiralis TaxID=6337 RepID=A0A0V1ICT6_TRIPS|nr:hypothetical protein T4A_3217 [Trichinella pseudospiralis]KRZ19829.1 hypothetical protein T4B_7739 [Trichinella pseudospiralis]
MDHQTTIAQRQQQQRQHSFPCTVTDRENQMHIEILSENVALFRRRTPLA